MALSQIPAFFAPFASDDHSFGCPIIYRDTIHNTSNDHLFGCPIIYMDTIHNTSNDHLFGCPIIYMDTIHNTSNDHLFGCPIIYMDTIHNTSNGCPIWWGTIHIHITYWSFIQMFIIYIAHLAVQSSRQTLFTLPAILVNLAVLST